MPEKRPFLEDGSQYGISRSEFRRMRKAQKSELMLQWFHENFEDPAVRTPYESAEGGYQWIWGGPHDAREELSSQFHGVVSEALIEEIAEEVERDGLTEWAPIHTVEDWEDIDSSDEPPSLDSFLDEPSRRYGTPEDHEARARARSALDQLRRALEKPRPIGIGHNRPPTEEEPEELKQLRPAVAALSAELAKPNPTITFVKRWAKPLRDAIIASGKWGAKKLDKGVDAGVKVAGAGAAVWLWGHSPALHNAFNAIIHWLHVAANTLP
jgi:hypothetical protein